MTSAALQLPHERLLQRLVKLLNARRRPMLVFCVCASPLLRVRIEDEIRLRAGAHPVVTGMLSGQRDPWTEMVEARDAAGGDRESTLSFALPAEALDVEARVLDRLNVGREYIARESLRVVLWAQGLAQQERVRGAAPDLWAHRVEVFTFLTADEFSLPPPSEKPGELDVALREVEAALARSTLQGEARDRACVLRAMLQLYAGGPVRVEDECDDEALTAMRYFARLQSVIASGEFGGFDAPPFARRSNVTEQETFIDPSQRASVALVRGQHGSAAHLREEARGALRSSLGTARMPEMLERSMLLDALMPLSLEGRHRTVLTQDLTFSWTSLQGAWAGGLIWLGAWPPAILARARSLHRSGDSLSALRELHRLLLQLVPLAARLYIDGVASESASIFISLGLPEEALRVLDLAARDDLRFAEPRSDVQRMHLRAKALRAKGEDLPARDLIEQINASSSWAKLAERSDVVRLGVELARLEALVGLDAGGDVSAELSGLIERAHAAGCDDIARGACEALRAHWVRHEQFERALDVCREALLRWEESLGPTECARWHVRSAEALLALDRAEEALSEADTAGALMGAEPEEHRSLVVLAAIAFVRARSLAVLSRADEALRALETVRAMLRDEDARHAEIELLNTLAELPLPVAYVDVRRAAAREALEMSRSALMLALEARSLANVASLSDASAATQAMLDEAERLARATGDESAMERVEAVRASLEDASASGELRGAA